MEENPSLFTTDSTTPCDFNISNQNPDTDDIHDTNISIVLKQLGIHSQNKHKYRNAFSKSNIQYHDFDNQDALTFTDKYTALLHQEPHVGVYTTQLQLKLTRFQKTWTSKLSHT